MGCTQAKAQQQALGTRGQKGTHSTPSQSTLDSGSANSASMLSLKAKQGGGGGDGGVRAGNGTQCDAVQCARAGAGSPVKVKRMVVEEEYDCPCLCETRALDNTCAAAPASMLTDDSEDESAF